jgi:hypothetical protein
MKRGRINRMAVTVKKYSCKNCGSVFDLGLAEGRLYKYA